jgi:anaerobic ribonucleoside-triphosphate reductase activating protein
MAYTSTASAGHRDDFCISGPYPNIPPGQAVQYLAPSVCQQVRVFNPAPRDRINWVSNHIEVHIFNDGSRLVTGYPGQLGLGADWTNP